MDYKTAIAMILAATVIVSGAIVLIDTGISDATPQEYVVIINVDDQSKAALKYLEVKEGEDVIPGLQIMPSFPGGNDTLVTIKLNGGEYHDLQLAGSEQRWSDYKLYWLTNNKCLESGIDYTLSITYYIHKEAQPVETVTFHIDIAKDITFYVNDNQAGEEDEPKVVRSFPSGANTLPSFSSLELAYQSHHFKNWNTLRDGSGTAYEDEAAIQLNSNLSLYAQWYEDTVKPTASNSPYDGGDHVPVAGSDAYTLSGEKKEKNAGNYVAYATPNDSYCWSDGTRTQVQLDWKITQLTATLVWDDSGLEYTGSALKPACSVGNLVSGDSCTVNVSGEGINVSGNPYTATATSLSNNNYALPTVVTHEFSITPKPISWPTIENKTYSGFTQIADVPESAYYDVTENLGGINASSYAITLTLKNTNYNWDGKGDLNLAWTKSDGFTIDRATITSITTSFNPAYDGDVHIPLESDLVYGFNNTKPDSTVTIVLKQGDDGTSAGSHTALVSVAEGATNFKKADSIEVSYSIGKMLVEWPTIEPYYYNGSEQTLVIDPTDLPYTLTSTTKGTDAGKYSVTLELKSTDYRWKDKDEDTLDWTKADAFEIKKGTITTITTQYAPTFSGTAQMPGADVLVYTGFNGKSPDSSKVTISLKSGDLGIDAVSHTAIVKVVGDSNFEDSEKEVSYSIGKKALVISVNANKTYTGENFEYTLANDDAPALVDGDSIHGKIVTIGSDVKDGGYTVKDTDWSISQAFTTDKGISNYDWSFGSVTLTIEKADLVATTDYTVTYASGLTYDGTDKALISTTLTKTGPKFQYHIGESEFADVIPTGKAADTYRVYWKILGGNNYNDVSGSSSDVTIGQKDVVIIVSSSMVYTGSEFEYTLGNLNIPELASGDSVTAGKLKTSGSDVAEYKATGAIGDQITVSQDLATSYGVGNYSVTYSVIMEITKADPTFTAPVGKNGLVYDGNEKELITAGSSSHGTFTYSLDDTTYAASIPKATEPGTYTVYWKLTGDNNHKDANGSVTGIAIGNGTISFSWTAPSDLVYSGTPKVPTVSITGIASEDQGKVSATIKLSDGKDNVNVGTFTYYVTGLTGESASKYDMPEQVVSSEYTITKKSLAVNISASKTYDGSAFVYTIKQSDLSGLVSGDSLTKGKITTNSAAVGTYDSQDEYQISEALAVQNGIANYDVGYTVSLVISEARYVLTFDPGMFTVKIGSSDIDSGTRVAYGTEVTVAASEGYTISSISLDGTPQTSTTGFSMPLKDTVLSVVVQGASHNITYNVSQEGGSVDETITSALTGQTVVLAEYIHPNDGYSLQSLTYKLNGAGDDVQISKTGFEMPNSDITVYVVFVQDAPTLYKITVSAMDNGTVTSSSYEAAQGETITLIVVPENGYILKAGTLVAMGETEIELSGSGNTWTFTMPAHTVTISAEFERLYTVTVIEPEHGTLQSSPTSGKAGTEVELTPSASVGYELDGVYVGDQKITPVNDKYIFTLQADVEVSAVFVKLYALTIDPQITGGTVEASATGPFKAGTSVTLTITPGVNKDLSQLWVAGSQVTPTKSGSVYTYTFQIQGDTFVTAEFSDLYSVTINNVTGGTITSSLSGSAPAGTQVTLTVSLSAGYKLDNLVINGEVITISGNSYVFTLQGDTTVTAAYSALSEYTVTFNSNGGTSVASQTVAAGGKVVKPTDPTKPSTSTITYTFAGWYSNPGLTTAYDFDSIVNSSFTLYAKWTETPIPGPSPGPTPGPTPTPSSETHANPDGSTTETTTKETTDRRTGETTKETTSTTTGTDGTKTVSEETTVTDKQGNSKTTSTSTTTDPEGNTTTTDYESTTKKNDDGSSTTESSSTTRSSDGSTSETTSKTETDKDGNSSTTSTTVSTDADGVTSTTTSTTTTTKGSDGSTTITETTQTRSSDGSTERTTSETKTDKNGKTTVESTTTATGADGITTTTVTKTEEGKGTGGTIITSTEEVSTSSDGSSHTTKTEITADGKGESRVKSTTEAIGTDGTKTTTVTESESKKNKDGSTTVNVKTEITNPDGSTVVQESETNVKTDKNGTVTTSVETDSELSDGTKVHEDTTTVVKKDGTVTQNTEVTTTAKDGSKTVSESESRTTTSDDGTVTKVTESTTEFADGTTDHATITEVRNPDGSRNIVLMSETENPDGSTTESQYESEVTVDSQGRTVTKTKGTEENSDGTGKTVGSTIVSQGGKDVSFEFTSVYDNLDSTTTTVKGSGTDEKVTVTLSGSRDVDVSDAMDSLTGIEAAVITIGMESKDGLKLSGDAVAEIAGENYGMWVQNGTMYLEVDSNVVSHIPTDAKEVELLIERADDTNMTKDQIPVVGDLYAVNVKLLVNGVEVHQLYGTASIVIEPGYSAAYVYYVDDEGNVELLESEYDEKTGELTFDVEHFSIYMVSAVPYEKKSGNNTVLIVGIVIAIVAILALVAFLLYRRRQSA